MFAAGPCLADNEIPPPPMFATTVNGVNLETGAFQYEATDLSIGPDASMGGISLVRNYSSARGYGFYSRSPFWATNQDIVLDQTLVERPTSASSTWIYQVNPIVGGSTMSAFQKSGNSFNRPYRPYDNDHAADTMAYVDGMIVYTDRAGTRYEFSNAIANGWDQRLVSSITYANGYGSITATARAAS